ncbi:MAG: hypothetical protein U9Q23_03705 [Candidatus Bipolaricaulota bacterium]|nr:hypothetical protein [Candidatus Bipolaricaulota bacterium]
MIQLLADTWFVAWRELVKFFRTKVRLVVTLVQPVIWLALMGNMMQRVNYPGLKSVACNYA